MGNPEKNKFFSCKIWLQSNGHGANFQMFLQRVKYLIYFHGGIGAGCNWSKILERERNFRSRKIHRMMFLTLELG